MSISKHLDLQELRKIQGFPFYFRYPLHQDDFHEVRDQGHLLGYFAAKPLYGRLTPEGKVDRSAGLSGEIAIVFLPSPVRSAKNARLLFTSIPEEEVTLANGHRNWAAIFLAARKRILEETGSQPSP